MDQFEDTSGVYFLQKTLQTPSHISSLAFGHAGHLFAGSDDGILRVYDLSSFKVLKAIRGLGSEVSSIVCVKRSGSELRDAWLACGNRILKFRMDTTEMISSLSEALVTIEMGETEDDILNELALNSNKTHLAFSMDSGVVGVIDLSNNDIIKMKTNHTSVCGSVKFIPDRPRELVSGGYDMILLHFDFMQGTVLSQYKIPAHTSTSGMALSPPFIMSMAISPTGVVAAGTADGRLRLGFAGEKRPSPDASTKKKRTRKWEGLKEAEELVIKIAEGPIVAMTFSMAHILTVSTMLGVVTQYEVLSDPKQDSVDIDKVWQKKTQGVEKVNALIVDEKRIIVGGLSKEGKGIIEIWQRVIEPDSNDSPKLVD